MLALGWVSADLGAGLANASELLDAALNRAGANRAELQKALDQAPAAQRDGLVFLIEQMPDLDLRTLNAAFLLENLDLAYRQFAEAPWKDRIPHDLFLNDILPYVCVNEPRDPWRRQLRELSLPLIAGAKTPSQAAQLLNQKLFALTKVKYSTLRKRPDQSPTETMSTGVATCTGLSILLADACRSVGIPARIAGTPMWTNLRGNHTWVEIWDGDWHFTGAAEPDPKGLDRGWFTHDASLAVKDKKQHAIYASSFRRTGTSFPMVWAESVDWVSAVNVTDRYIPARPAGNPSETRLLVKVLEAPGGKRIATTVRVSDPAKPGQVLTGSSRAETADLNDILPFQVAKDHSFVIEADGAAGTVRHEFRTGSSAQDVAVLYLSDIPVAPMVCKPPTLRTARDTKPLSTGEITALRAELNAWFQARAAGETIPRFSGSSERSLLKNEESVRNLAWEAYASQPSHATMRQDFDLRRVQSGSQVSPYTLKTIGVRPPSGWPLFIAMHGGGGVPREVNDSQWKIMQSYYHNHPEVGGYRYLALRAPNDTWNGFYDDYVYPLIDRLVQQSILFGDVDPNKVFIMGYSHGGYGAFAIGPKMPDRFAAIHASAAAPTDGLIAPETLRNTRFTYMIGENDTAYGRLERCQKFNTSVGALKGSRLDVFPVLMEFKPGQGHGGLPDRDKIVEMYPAIRQPVPEELSWKMTDKVIHDFFWLHADQPAAGQSVHATLRQNQLEIQTSGTEAPIRVYLDERTTDLSKPVQLTLNGTQRKLRCKPSLQTLCETLARRGDPYLAYTCEVVVWDKKAK